MSSKYSTSHKISYLAPLMFRALFRSRIRGHAIKIFTSLFPKGYAGEVFLCGGAFKPLLKKGLPINDLDLWVRNRKEREKLCAALVERGAHLVQDFHPFCIKYRLEGIVVEITYNNVKQASLADVVNTFDLAISGMGVRYMNGRVVESYLSEECWQAIRGKRIAVLDSYFCFVLLEKAPSLLRSLHRMGQQASELGYKVDADHEHRLWGIYWQNFTEEERRAAMDIYFETVVTYKGQHDEHLVRRATAVAYAPVTREVKRTEKIKPQPSLTPKVA